MSTLGDQLTVAYDDLMVAEAAHAVATDTAVEAKADLEEAEALAIYEGQVTGKNAQERAAAARQLLAPYHATLRQAEAKQRAERLQLDLASLTVKQLHARLRCLEIEAAALQVQAAVCR